MIDVCQYHIDGYVLLDVDAERIGDANIYENKQIKQQMQLISKMLNSAFCSKEISCEKVMEIDGCLYCAILVEKENALLNETDGFEENAIALINNLNSASDLFVGMVVNNDFDGADDIVNKYALSKRPIDIAEYSNSRMTMENEIVINFKNQGVCIQPLERCNLDVEIDSSPESVEGIVFCGYATSNKFVAQLASGEHVMLEYKDEEKDLVKSITYCEEKRKFTFVRRCSRFLKNKKSDNGKLVSISSIDDIKKQSLHLFSDVENQQKQFCCN